jgi:hypothetical protein
VQGKRILFLECLLDKGFSHYLVLLLKSETLTGQGLRNLDAFALLPKAIPKVAAEKERINPVRNIAVVKPNKESIKLLDIRTF